MLDYLRGQCARLLTAEGRGDVSVFRQAQRHIREAQVLPFRLGGERVNKIYNDRSGDDPICYTIEYHRHGNLSQLGTARDANAEFWVLRGDRVIGVVMASTAPHYGDMPKLTPSWTLTA